MIVHQKKIADVYNDGSEIITAYMLFPDKSIKNIKALVVIENSIRNTYNQDYVLIPVTNENNFSHIRLSRDVCRRVEDELGYVPETFLYQDDYMNVFARLMDLENGEQIVRDVLEFIYYKINGDESPVVIQLDIDDMVQEIYHYQQECGFDYWKDSKDD